MFYDTHGESGERNEIENFANEKMLEIVSFLIIGSH